MRVCSMRSINLFIPLAMSKNVLLNYAGWKAVLEKTSRANNDCNECVLNPGTCDRICMQGGHFYHVSYFRRYGYFRTVMRYFSFLLTHKFYF